MLLRGFFLDSHRLITSPGVKHPAPHSFLSVSPNPCRPAAFAPDTDIDANPIGGRSFMEKNLRKNLEGLGQHKPARRRRSLYSRQVCGTACDKLTTRLAAFASGGAIDKSGLTPYFTSPATARSRTTP
jgi:hypothetical protein